MCCAINVADGEGASGALAEAGAAECMTHDNKPQPSHHEYIMNCQYIPIAAMSIKVFRLRKQYRISTMS
jgi:hypothetical protein